MKWVLLCGAPAVIAGGLYFHGPLRSGETYARPAADVAYTLETMTLPDYVAGQIDRLPSGSSRRDVVPGKSVTYYFFSRGGQAAKFVAEVHPIDAGHTRVSTYMTMADDADKLMKTEFMPVAKEFKIVGAAAMNEQIDARMEKRAFNKEVVTQAMAGFAVANIGEIQKGVGDAMQEAAKRSRELDAPSQRAIVPGQPMVDTTR